LNDLSILGLVIAALLGAGLLVLSLTLRFRSIPGYTRFLRPSGGAAHRVSILSLIVGAAFVFIPLLLIGTGRIPRRLAEVFMYAGIGIVLVSAVFVGYTSPPKRQLRDHKKRMTRRGGSGSS
jgi:hypothetical protein